MVADFRDATDRRNAEALLWQQTHCDTLTSLPNRRMLRDCAGHKPKLLAGS